MTEATSASQNNNVKYSYDYADKCDCSEDDKCGCSYPNNMPHDFSVSINREKTEIKTENVHLKEESICICSPTQCECSITHNEKSK